MTTEMRNGVRLTEVGGPTVHATREEASEVADRVREEIDAVLVKYGVGIALCVVVTKFADDGCPKTIVLGQQSDLAPLLNVAIMAMQHASDAVDEAVEAHVAAQSEGDAQ